MQSQDIVYTHCMDTHQLYAVCISMGRSKLTHHEDYFAVAGVAASLWWHNTTDPLEYIVCYCKVKSINSLISDLSVFVMMHF